ncbi:MAG: MotA/TolQ/ExbB proton channel family protein [Psychrobacter sp.]|jgi:biopolymer transport protein ExbB|uniref:MotA/TolQ/ExbB proton channel family protein n=1 Tax=Psychrobacter namhaensis TaxID=292734 RepID=UPI0018DFD00B|nr:MotA/TolQ/ExbB proton channel family protein [Psychrobacter namhaensis]MCD6252386.1 MotA/TolQ/ExbB proton channel family protein [Psychrobacter sp.]
MDFTAYWQYSDMVTKSLFFVLLALSVISWVTGIIRVLQSRKLAANVADDLSQQIQPKQAELTESDAATRRLVTEQTLLKHIGRYRFASERGLPILGTTAAIAPFIGLFGTVWGIFHALHNIGMSGQAGLGQVAAPVGEALIMTGLGIAVAIPAVVFYNLAVRINRRVMYHANDRAHDLLANSAKLAASPQSRANSTPIATQAQSAKDQHIMAEGVQQAGHYSRSASS